MAAGARGQRQFRVGGARLLRHARAVLSRTKATATAPASVCCNCIHFSSTTETRWHSYPCRSLKRTTAVWEPSQSTGTVRRAGCSALHPAHVAQPCDRDRAGLVAHLDLRRPAPSALGVRVGGRRVVGDLLSGRAGAPHAREPLPRDGLGLGPNVELHVVVPAVGRRVVVRDVLRRRARAALRRRLTAHAREPELGHHARLRRHGDHGAVLRAVL